MWVLSKRKNPFRVREEVNQAHGPWLTDRYTNTGGWWLFFYFWLSTLKPLYNIQIPSSIHPSWHFGGYAFVLRLQMESSLLTNNCSFSSHNPPEDLNLIGNVSTEEDYIYFHKVYLEHPAANVSTQIGQVPPKKTFRLFVLH